MPTPTPIPLPVFSNVITYDDLAIITLLLGILIILAVVVILYVLFNTLVRRGGKKL
jgi:hypothetical protein